MSLPAPTPTDDLVIIHFLVVSDQDRSRAFYQSLLGGQVLRERDPVILEVANTRLILNVGGGPTDDKPTVVLTTPSDPDRASSFLNIRVGTSTVCTRSGPPGVECSSPHPRTTVTRSGRTCVIPMAT
jgi:hypothetical protein